MRNLNPRASKPDQWSKREMKTAPTGTLARLELSSLSVPTIGGNGAWVFSFAPYAAAVFFCGPVMCGFTTATIASNAAGSVMASSLSILRFKPMPLSAMAGMKRL